MPVSKGLSKPDEAKLLVPFLKWPGGKRWFVRRYANLFPEKYRSYFEPFLGGASVYFHLRPSKALLGDTNSDLIDTYRGIKSDWKEVVTLLTRHNRKHSDKYYYELRDQRPRRIAEKAARFIYLNRTCFNGIYRVNLAGEFNVPRGSKDSVLLDTDNFKELAALLKGAKLHTVNFDHLISEAGRNDLLFVDPPYTVRHNVNGFVKYNEKLFSWEDQERLAKTLQQAKRRGAIIVGTNANHESVRDLYKKHGFRFEEVSRFSAISANAAGRSQYEELLITANL